MKAVLVVDMPTTCEECELDKLYNDIRVYCDHPFREGKNPSCPLRPLPDKQKNRPQTGGYTRGFTAGFNKFRYLITGETE